MGIHPTEVKFVEADGILMVTFSDGQIREFAAAFLRGFCPCAHCQGHSAGPVKWNALATPAASRVEDVTPVGNYGMCIIWGDGHDTGIYSYQRLWAMPGDPNFDASSMEVGTALEI